MHLPVRLRTPRYTDGVLTCREFDPVAATDEVLRRAACLSGAVLRARVPNAPGGEPYVSKTANLRRRLERLLWRAANAAQVAPAQPARARQRRRVAAGGRRLRGGLCSLPAAARRVSRTAMPRGCICVRRRCCICCARMRIRALTVTSRIRSLRSGGEYFGPFASRAEAEQYANDSLDFFLLRRCTEELDPDPSFPGCVYSEMKMCLAPCFQGCTDERYAEEAARVERYLESGGHSLLVEIGRARDEASARLEFEAAAAAHARLEKLKAVQGRVAEIVHRIDRLNGVLLQPSHLPGHIALFRIAGGMLAGPIAFDVSARAADQHASKRRAATRRICDVRVAASAHSQSMEARIKEVLRSARGRRRPPAHRSGWSIWPSSSAGITAPTRWGDLLRRRARRAADAPRGARGGPGAEGRKTGRRSQRDGRRLLGLSRQGGGTPPQHVHAGRVREAGTRDTAQLRIRRGPCRVFQQRRCSGRSPPKYFRRARGRRLFPRHGREQGHGGAKLQVVRVAEDLIHRAPLDRIHQAGTLAQAGSQHGVRQVRHGLCREAIPKRWAISLSPSPFIWGNMNQIQWLCFRPARSSWRRPARKLSPARPRTVPD